MWLVIVKGGINTRASARYEFGLGALSSHAASQSRPPTISGVPEVREGGITTAMNTGWVSPVGATFLSQKDIFTGLFKVVHLILSRKDPLKRPRSVQFDSVRLNRLHVLCAFFGLKSGIIFQE